MAPVVDGRVGTAALFDIDEHAAPQRLQLQNVESLSDGLIWLRYAATPS